MRRCGMSFASVMGFCAEKCFLKSLSVKVGGRPRTKMRDEAIEFGGPPTAGIASYDSHLYMRGSGDSKISCAGSYLMT